MSENTVTAITFDTGKRRSTTYQLVWEERMPDDDMRRDHTRCYWSPDGGETVSHVTSHVRVWPHFERETLVAEVSDYGDTWGRQLGLVSGMHASGPHARALLLVLENPGVFSPYP